MNDEKAQPVLDIDSLTVAFGLHMIELIIGADDTIDTRERALLRDRYPIERLRTHGFIDAQGDRTDRYHEAAMMALDHLPTRLSEARKVALIRDFIAAMLADGVVDLAEGRAVVDGAVLLGLGDQAIAEVLESHPGLSSFELEDFLPEDDLG